MKRMKKMFGKITRYFPAAIIRKLSPVHHYCKKHLFVALPVLFMVVVVLGWLGNEAIRNQYPASDGETAKTILASDISEEELKSQKEAANSDSTREKTSASASSENRSGGPYPAGSYSSGALVASPSSVNLGTMTNFTEVTIRSSTNEPIFQPTASSLPGLITFIEGPNPSPGGGPATQTSWQLTIRRSDFNSGGKEYITVSDNGRRFTSTKILVSWTPAPSFSIVQGGLTRSDGTNSITHTASFSIVPNNPYFGTPMMTILMNGGACNQSPEFIRTFTYNGNNSFTMNCVVERIPPHIPGNPPPPLPSEASFSISVSGTVNGQFIKGPESITYILPSGYDR